MTVTSDDFPGIRKEDTLELRDNADGNPLTAGQVKYDANRFVLKDNSAVYGPDEVRVSDNDTTPDKLINKITGDGVTVAEVNDGNNETLKLTVAGDGVAPYSININPETLATQGNNPTHIVANDYAALEFSKSKTDFGSWSALWQRTPSADVTVKVQFILRSSSSGTVVRIGIKTKSKAVGEDSSSGFDAEVVDPVTINTTTIGEIFQATLTIPAATFADGDATTLNIGRDGQEEISGGAADDFNEAIHLIAVRVQVP